MGWGCRGAFEDLSVGSGLMPEGWEAKGEDLGLGVGREKMGQSLEGEAEDFFGEELSELHV